MSSGVFVHDQGQIEPAKSDRQQQFSVRLDIRHCRKTNLLLFNSYNAYALCYGCHDRNSILGDESFAEHDSHVRGHNTPCSVCHDPHGISETQGDSRNHQYLINFDINVVSPNSLGDLYWEEGVQGPGSSRCSLACHGVDHNNTEDKPIGFDESNGLSGSSTSWPFSGAFPD